MNKMKTVKELDGSVWNSKDEVYPIAEEVLLGLVGKTIHATTNKLVDREGNEHNVWFAGVVAGYQKAVLAYDYIGDKVLDVANVQFQMLLTDGMAYTLSCSDLEIKELTEDEFAALVAEFTAAQVTSDIILPEKKEKKIILPGRDF
jgi:hypothetical protein